MFTFSAGITAMKMANSDEEDDDDDDDDEISNENSNKNSNDKKVNEETPSSILKRALIAMKMAQNKGKNTVEVFL